jgi:hypothetical protein
MPKSVLIENMKTSWSIHGDAVPAPAVRTPLAICIASLANLRKGHAQDYATIDQI